MACRPWATGLALWLGLAACADAGSFAVSPVRVTIAPGRTASALTVHNNGTEATVIQLEVLTWTQHDGADAMEPTRALIATPPIFDLQPGGSQIIRVGLRGALPDTLRETPFRLLVKEIAPPLAPDARGLRMALHISLPVFVPGMSAPTHALLWDATRVDGLLHLGARNAGNAHVQVNSIAIEGTDARPQALASYVLPGQRREWPIHQDMPVGRSLHLVAQTDAGELQADVVVTAP